MWKLTFVQGIDSGRWHQSFKIPEKSTFSGSVQRAIDTGVISSKTQQEIAQTLRMHILQHTRYPSPEEYTSVCQQLILKFPKLRDTIGSNGFVSYGSREGHSGASPNSLRSLAEVMQFRSFAEVSSVCEASANVRS